MGGDPLHGEDDNPTPRSPRKINSLYQFATLYSVFLAEALWNDGFGYFPSTAILACRGCPIDIARLLVRFVSQGPLEFLANDVLEVPHRERRITSTRLMFNTAAALLGSDSDRVTSAEHAPLYQDRPLFVVQIGGNSLGTRLKGSVYSGLRFS